MLHIVLGSSRGLSADFSNLASLAHLHGWFAVLAKTLNHQRHHPGQVSFYRGQCLVVASSVFVGGESLPANAIKRLEDVLYL